MGQPYRPVQNEPNSIFQSYSTGSSHASGSMAMTNGRSRDPTYTITARTCADHIIRLFASPIHPPPPPPSTWQHHLATYISGVLQRAYEMRIVDSAGTCESIAVAAMTLLSRYQTLKPDSVAHDIEAYRLFIAAFCIAVKEVGTQGGNRREWWAYVATEPDGSVKFTNEELAKLERALRHALRGDVSINVAAVVRIQRSISRRRRMHQSSVDNAGSDQSYVRRQDFGENDRVLDVNNCQDYYLGSREEVYIEVNPPNERHNSSTEDTAPPSYQEASRDMRVVETGAIGDHALSHTIDPRLYRTTQIPLLRSSPNLRGAGNGRQPRRSLPVAPSASVADESEEDRIALARMFVAEPRPAPALSPLATIKQKIGGEGASHSSIVGAVKKGVVRLVHQRLQTASRPGVTRRRSNTA